MCKVVSPVNPRTLNFLSIMTHPRLLLTAEQLIMYRRAPPHIRVYVKAPPGIYRWPAMKSPLPSDDQVEILSDDSSSDADDKYPRAEQQNDEPSVQLSDEAWLFRRASSYQEYMSLIPVPTDRKTVIPCKTWTGLGNSIKQIYEQPLHYFTNIHLQKMDQARSGGRDQSVNLDAFIHPVKAETSVWIIEEAHRLTASPHQLHKMWTDDPMYHRYIDAIFPKLGRP